MTQSPAESIFRPAALEAYRSGRMRTLDVMAYRPPRWPLIAVAVLAVVVVAFSAVLPVPSFVRAAPLGVDAGGLVAVTPAAMSPVALRAGEPATLRVPGHDDVGLRVAEVTTVADRAAAQRLDLPPGIALPTTVVRLTGDGPVDRSMTGGTIAIRTGNPSLLSKVAARLGGEK
jgi:hypothetical protein